MTGVVLDASALVEFLIRSPSGIAMETWIVAADSDLHIPTLCDVEVCAVVRRALLREVVAPQRAAELLQDYRDLPLTRHGHLGLMDRILQLRRNFSAYDATYVALADKLGTTRFATCDRSLARAVRLHFPKWQVLDQSSP